MDLSSWISGGLNEYVIGGLHDMDDCTWETGIVLLGFSSTDDIVVSYNDTSKAILCELNTVGSILSLYVVDFRAIIY